MLNKLKFLVPLPTPILLLISGFQFDPSDEKFLSETRDPAQRVVTSLLERLAVKRYRLTEQGAKEIEGFLNTFADDIEKVLRRIREKS